MRANNVIVSILQYSRTAEIEVKMVNIYNVIDAAIELIRNTAKEHNVLIQKYYNRVEHQVGGNGVMLQQVFFDLMSNSIDAMPDGGNIDVTVDFHPAPEGGEKKGGNFVIQVKDTGCGMDAAQLKKIFDPFYTTKEAGKGTGLGLSTVFLIIDKHEGHITVESKKNEGTIFTIVLPAAEQQSQLF
jgi:signal transduction histidine kinase